MNGIEIRDLACERGGRILFKDLHFQVPTGQSLRLIGPNGCGKTSLLRILAGQLSPSVKLPTNPLYLDHKPLMKDVLTVHENLEFWSKLYGASYLQVTLALKQMGLAQLSMLPFGDLSSGQKKRVQLALLTFCSAHIWLLDEPLLSLDSTYAQRLSDTIKAHLQKDGVVVYASHEPIPGLSDQVLDLSDFRGSHVRHAA